MSNQKDSIKLISGKTSLTVIILNTYYKIKLETEIQSDRHTATAQDRANHTAEAESVIDIQKLSKNKKNINSNTFYNIMRHQVNSSSVNERKTSLKIFLIP